MTRTTGRNVASVIAGMLAVVAAAVAARGPAVAEQAAFNWPPAQVPNKSPTRTWISPLLLARHTPAAIDAHVPCGAVPTLGDRATPEAVLFSTTRDYARTGGLAVVQSRHGAVAVRVGTRVLARSIAKPSGDCAFDIVTRENTYFIDAHGRRVASGTLPSAPTVFGFFTQLDLRAKPALDVEILPAAEDTRPTAKQTAFRILAALLIGVGIALLITPAMVSRRFTARLRFPRIAAQDGLVASSLTAWWFLAPIQDDDGWVRARQVNSLVSGGFSNYFESWGANLPLDAWYEWLQHWVVAYSTSLALQRLPSVVLVGAAWLMCRRCLVLLLGAGPSRRSAPWWCAAAAFVVGASAFGFTLRPEPGIALLASVSLLCCLCFARSPAVMPVLFAVMATGMATTVHPAGLVVAAPILLCIPQMIRAARARRGLSMTSLIAVGAVGVAWGLLLSYLDFDMRSRAEDVSLVSGGGHNYGIPGEYYRYMWLANFGASPLRRETVVVLLLCVVALFVVVPWRRRTLVERLPSGSIGLSLILLTLTPSKWIWHFGTLIGFAAVAAGFEASKLATVSISARARWVIACVVVMTAVWAAGEGERWGPFDTMHVDWSSVPLGEPIIGVFLIIAVLAVRGRIARPEAATFAAVLLALFMATTAAFATDAATADGWTASRQSLRSLVGSDACGLASDLVVPVPDTMRRLSLIRTAPAGRRGARPSDQRSLARRPTGSRTWYAVPRTSIGVWVSGLDPDDGLTVAWGRQRGSHVVPLRSALIRERQALPGSVRSSWRFVTDRSFPSRPANADAIEITQFDPSRHGQVTAPVSYASANLGGLFARRDVQPLVSPFLYAGVPCASTPHLTFGVASAPDVLMDWNHDGWTALGNWSSPFLGLADVFDVRRVPIDNRRDGRAEIQVHWVRLDPRDAIAPAKRSLVST